MTKTLRLECLHCGTSFLAGNSSAKWCGYICRKRAFRRRHSPVQARRMQEACGAKADPAPHLPTRATPLIGHRPTDAELASQLQQKASETLESIQFELELLNEPSTPTVVKAIAQELNATAHRFARLAAVLATVA